MDEYEGRTKQKYKSKYELKENNKQVKGNCLFNAQNMFMCSYKKKL